jgi:hypothetical protein
MCGCSYRFDRDSSLPKAKPGLGKFAPVPFYRKVRQWLMLAALVEAVSTGPAKKRRNITASGKRRMAEGLLTTRRTKATTRAM